MCSIAPLALGGISLASKLLKKPKSSSAPAQPAQPMTTQGTVGPSPSSAYGY